MGFREKFDAASKWAEEQQQKNKKKTIIETFKKTKDAEKFVNKMQKQGYKLVDLSDGKKHYSITKGAGAAVLLGPLGLIAGHGKNRITVTMTLVEDE